MRQFNYQSLADLRAESGELMKLLEAEHWGIGMDRIEHDEEMRQQIESQQQGM